jgi:transcriptional regulator NrdR family protein
VEDTVKFEKAALCPSCGKHLFRVIESRNVNGIKRRRRACKNASCGHRETTYEIDASDYQLLKKARAIEKILLGAETSAHKEQVFCSSCDNWVAGKCEFSFPEAGGRFAEECSLYRPRKTF